MAEKKAVNMEAINEVNYVGLHNAPEIYADGLSGILLGFPTLKMTFHTVLPSGSAEIRRNCAILTMDVYSALDMAFDILDSCKDSEEQFLLASTGIHAKLKDLLSRIPAEPSAESTKTVTKSRAKAKSKA